MGYLFNNRTIHNPGPDQFVFWTPPNNRLLTVGPEQTKIPLPQIPIPIRRQIAVNEPSDQEIGESVYEFLRRFPECLHNEDYAFLIRDAYPHYLADLAAHAVMLDAKEVAPAYIVRKLTALKILRLLDRENQGLLFQLCKGYYDLALNFNELSNCHRHLVSAMIFGSELMKKDPDNHAALWILAEIDMLLCDYPAAAKKWERLQSFHNESHILDEIDRKLAQSRVREMPNKTLVEDLEAVGKAMELYAAKSYEMAKFILERLEEDQFFIQEFPSAQFYFLLGMCRLKNDDLPGAHVALTQSLDIDPDYEPAQQALDKLQT